MKRFAILFAMAALSLPGNELILAEKGASNYVIAVSGAADTQSRAAAADFAGIFKEMTGIRLETVREDQVPAGKKVISIGNTTFAAKAGIDASKLNREEYIVRTAGDSLILTGGKASGIRYSVYEFFEKAGKCEWFDGFTVQIPKTEKFVLPELNIRHVPDFIYRKIYTQAFGIGGKYKTALPLKFSNPNDVIGSPGDVHTFYEYSKDWPKDNLALFTKNERGKREIPRGQIGPNFCLTNPETAELVTKKLRGFIESNRAASKRADAPNRFVYNISMNDCTRYFCLCKNCMAEAEKYNQSGLLLRFINKIAENIKNDYPEILVDTLAYEYTEQPPKGGVIPADNVMIRLCRTRGDYFQPIEKDRNSGFGDDLKIWGGIGKNLSIWEYWVFYWDPYPAPYHNIHHIKQNFELYRKLNVKMLFVESEAWESSIFFAMKLWIGYKLMDDLSQSDTELIARFMKGFYGPGAEGIREFYDYMVIRQKEASRQVFGAQAKNPPDLPYLDTQFYLTVEKMFDKAEAACKPGSIELKNVRRERMTVDESMLYLWPKLHLPFDKEKILKRYEDYRTEHIRFRRTPVSQSEALGTLKSEINKLKNSAVIEKQKKAPLQTMKVPKSDNWNQSASVTKWFEYYGVPTNRRLALRARHFNGKLYLRLTETGLDRKLSARPHLWDGDEWEIMLGRKQFGEPYLQILADCAGKKQFLLQIPQADGKDKPEGRHTGNIEVSSEEKNNVWTLDVTVPLSEIPGKGDVLYGNFFRSSNGAELAQCWNPTFEKQFPNRKAFGKIILEK